ADRDREEERDHDDRLRPRGRARREEAARAGHLRGVPAALPSDHDDDDGSAARRAPPGPRHRDGRGAPPAARHHDRRRPAREPAAHALHDAGRLPRLRPAVATAVGAAGDARGRGGTGGTVSISRPFIERPVATSLLTGALALVGVLAFRTLPVAPLPQVAFPTIQVSATLPGARPETMASAVALPLERQFSRIAGITDMASTSYLGSTTVVLQFDLGRNIDAAARDVQAAINAARGQLPSNLPNNPNYRKVNPADAPIFILALTSQT